MRAVGGCSQQAEQEAAEPRTDAPRDARRACPRDSRARRGTRCRRREALTVAGGLRRGEMQGDLGALEARLPPVGDGLQLHAVVRVGLKSVQSHRVVGLGMRETHTKAIGRRGASPVARKPTASYRVTSLIFRGRTVSFSFGLRKPSVTIDQNQFHRKLKTRFCFCFCLF